MRSPDIDKAQKKVLLDARAMVQHIMKRDSNESETRSRIEHIFETVLGYDVFRHVSREHAVHGSGDTVHCDFAVQLEQKESSKPIMLVEIKRVGIDLVPRHLRQAASYAIDMGCEWIVLTNGRDWKLYHTAFGKPPQTKLVKSWNLFQDEPEDLARNFAFISYKNVKRRGLDKLWAKSNVLNTHSMVQLILAEESIRLFQRGIRRRTDVSVSPEDIVGAIRYLFNEAALSEMANITISLPARQKRAKPSRSSKPNKEATEGVETIQDAQQSEE